MLTGCRWLFKKGREEEAIQVLCAVFDLPPTDPYITSEVANIKHALAVESGVTSHRALFRKDKLKTRRRIMLAYFGLFMNQMVTYSPFSCRPPKNGRGDSPFERLSSSYLSPSSITLDHITNLPSCPGRHKSCRLLHADSPRLHG